MRVLKRPHGGTVALAALWKTACGGRATGARTTVQADGASKQHAQQVRYSPSIAGYTVFSWTN